MWPYVGLATAIGLASLVAAAVLVPSRLDSAVFMVVVTAPFLIVGAIVARREPENTVGWLLLGVGVLEIVDAPVGVYAANGGEGWEWAGWVAGFTIPPLLYGPIIFLLLLFPNGRLPFRGARIVAWLAAAALALAAGLGARGGPAVRRRPRRTEPRRRPAGLGPAGRGPRRAARVPGRGGGAGGAAAALARHRAAPAHLVRLRRGARRHRPGRRDPGRHPARRRVGGVEPDLVPGDPFGALDPRLRGHRDHPPPAVRDRAVIDRTLVYGTLTALVLLGYGLAVFLASLLASGAGSRRAGGRGARAIAA